MTRALCWASALSHLNIHRGAGRGPFTGRASAAVALSLGLAHQYRQDRFLRHHWPRRRRGGWWLGRCDWIPGPEVGLARRYGPCSTAGAGWRLDCWQSQENHPDWMDANLSAPGRDFGPCGYAGVRDWRGRFVGVRRSPLDGGFGDSPLLATHDASAVSPRKALTRCKHIDFAASCMLPRMEAS